MLRWSRWQVTYWDGLPVTDGRPSKYYPSSAWSGVELTTCWSQVRRPNHYTMKPTSGTKMVAVAQQGLFYWNICVLISNRINNYFFVTRSASREFEYTAITHCTASMHALYRWTSNLSVEFSHNFHRKINTQMRTHFNVNTISYATWVRHQWRRCIYWQRQISNDC